MPPLVVMYLYKMISTFYHKDLPFRLLSLPFLLPAQHSSTSHLTFSPLYQCRVKAKEENKEQRSVGQREKKRKIEKGTKRLYIIIYLFFSLPSIANLVSNSLKNLYSSLHLSFLFFPPNTFLLLIFFLCLHLAVIFITRSYNPHSIYAIDLTRQTSFHLHSLFIL